MSGDFGVRVVGMMTTNAFSLAGQGVSYVTTSTREKITRKEWGLADCGFCIILTAVVAPIYFCAKKVVKLASAVAGFIVAIFWWLHEPKMLARQMRENLETVDQITIKLEKQLDQQERMNLLSDARLQARERLQVKAEIREKEAIAARKVEAAAREREEEARQVETQRNTELAFVLKETSSELQQVKKTTDTLVESLRTAITEQSTAHEQDRNEHNNTLQKLQQVLDKQAVEYQATIADRDSRILQLDGILQGHANALNMTKEELTGKLKRMEEILNKQEDLVVRNEIVLTRNESVLDQQEETEKRVQQRLEASPVSQMTNDKLIETVTGILQKEGVVLKQNIIDEMTRVLFSSNPGKTKGFGGFYCSQEVV